MKALSKILCLLPVLLCLSYPCFADFNIDEERLITFLTVLAAIPLLSIIFTIIYFWRGRIGVGILAWIFTSLAAYIGLVLSSGWGGGIGLYLLVPLFCIYLLLEKMQQGREQKTMTVIYVIKSVVLTFTVLNFFCAQVMTYIFYAHKAALYILAGSCLLMLRLLWLNYHKGFQNTLLRTVVCQVAIALLTWFASLVYDVAVRNWHDLVQLPYMISRQKFVILTIVAENVAGAAVIYWLFGKIYPTDHADEIPG